MDREPLHPLEPVRAGLVAHPAQWSWSCYPGYAEAGQRRSWVAHEALLAAWRGEYGGREPTAAYRGFVEAGLADPLRRRSGKGSGAGC